jgi:hypothetical protein
MAAGMREALDHAGFDGVAGPYDDNRNFGGALLGRDGRGIAAAHDQIDVAPDQLIDHFRQPIQPPSGCKALEDYRLAVDIPTARQRLFKTGGKDARAGRADMQESDPMDFIRGLSECGHARENRKSDHAEPSSEHCPPPRTRFIGRRHDIFRIDA